MDKRRKGGKYVRTPPKCPLCRDHGVITLLRGHRKHCPYIDCKCEKCLLIKERNKQMLANKTDIYRGEEPEWRRELNGSCTMAEPYGCWQNFPYYDNAMIFGFNPFLRPLYAGKDIGYTPLMKAVRTNQIECTARLLEKGACVNEQNRVDGKSCLHMACYMGYIDLARMLVRHGANINARDVDGSTPLHCIAKSSLTSLVRIDLSELLIDEGADVNAKDTQGDTPLHYAIMAIKYADRDNSSVEWLIGNGARFDITNNNNQTPFDVAQRNPDVEAIMAKHITKMRVAGLHVGVSSEIVDQDMRVKYLEEIEQIKSTKINEKHTLDVLLSNSESPMYLTTSKAFVENMMTTPTLEENFPHYASLLRIQYKLASKRFELLNLANRSLSDHRNMTYLHKLPYMFIQKTLEYLNNKEVQSLVKSLNISQALDD